MPIQSIFALLMSIILIPSDFAFGLGPVIDVLSPAAVTKAHDSDCWLALEDWSVEVQLAERQDVRVELNVVERHVHCRLK